MTFPLSFLSSAFYTFGPVKAIKDLIMKTINSYAFQENQYLDHLNSNSARHVYWISEHVAVLLHFQKRWGSSSPNSEFLDIESWPFQLLMPSSSQFHMLS